MAEKANRSEKIDLNAAAPRQLTQLPGIAKNTAYNIVNYRDRHGLFTSWDELTAVKEFPVEKLDLIKQHATLGEVPPTRRPKGSRPRSARKVTAGYTHKIRTTKNAKRLHAE
jgi:hypothetical protein